MALLTKDDILRGLRRLDAKAKEAGAGTERHAHLLNVGLHVPTLSAQGAARVRSLAQTYTKPGRNDLVALDLPEAEKCPLLTGDAALRQAAETGGVAVRGTVWLIGEMVREQRITVAVAGAL